MRLVLIISLVCIMQSFALDSYTQNSKISLSVKEMRLEDILMQIENETKYRFAYNKPDIDVDQVYTINIQEADIKDVLNQLFADKKINYSVVDRQIVLSRPEGSFAVSQQPRSISGKVTDSSGSPLPGVTVVVKGTTSGTITGADGSYSLANVPSDATLVFSFVGMKAQEIPIASKGTINLTMLEETVGIEEVVAVGYGTQRKSDVAGSVAVATADDILKSSSFNALQGMKGKVSGVNIYTNSGNPTGNTRVVIRGINSINTSSSPLFVVDGVQMDNFSYINPNDIERVEVLKDASAAAIYGARGANGVILVTTKRGAGEGKGVTITYDGWLSVGMLARKVDMMNSKEFLEVEEIGFSNFSKYSKSQQYIGLEVNKSDPLIFDANGNPLYDTDWQEETTRTTVSHSHQLNIQQQGDMSSTGVFLNYTDQQGIMLNNYMKRLNAKFTYDADPKPWLSTGINLMVNHTWANDVDETSGSQIARRTMLEMPPIFPVKFPDGSWSTTQYEGTKLNLGLESMCNPVHELLTRKMNRFRTKIFGNTFFTLHIIKGLDLKTQIGVDADFYKAKDYSPNDLTNISSPNGSASISSSNDYYWQEETFLSYNKDIGMNRINAVAGLAWSQSTSSSDGTGTVKGFTTNYFGYNNLGAGTTPSAPNSSWRRWSMNSYFLRAGYTLKDKYLATITARVDGSSRFGKNNHYGFFPSTAIGWIISNEDFLNDINWLDNLKLHTSYGRTGNTEISAYSTLANVSSGTVLINGSRASNAYVSSLANPDLEWEKTDQFDFGINLALFDNIVSLDLDYYYKLTSDLLLAKPVPYTTGYTSVMDNIGKVSNRGLDILLKTINIKKHDFRWETTFSASYNKNRIEKLGENDEDILVGPTFNTGDIILRKGESLGSFYAYKRYGTWGTNEAAEAALEGAVPGEAKRSASREIIGKGLPDWTGSLINSFFYKNWDLYFDLQFVYGVEAWQLFIDTIEERSGIANGLSGVLYNSWTESNQNTVVQQIRQAYYSGQNLKNDSHWVCDGSYVRGNLIQLGYTFNLKKQGFKTMRAYASVNNAFLICSSDFKGFDPEAVSNTNQFGQNVFFYQYPKPRTFTFGVNVSF